MAAGLATLQLVRRPGQYERLEALSARLEAGLSQAARSVAETESVPDGMPFCSNRAGSMLTGFFCPGPVTDYVSALSADRDRYGRFFHLMLRRGVYLAPSQFEAAFVSLAHSEADVDYTVDAAADAMRELTRA
jgi:glutamate-1-semialdehyde 2,1-aminomutase